MFVFDVVGFNFGSRVILIGQVLYLGSSGEILINFIRSSFDDRLCLGTAIFDALSSLGTPGETLINFNRSSFDAWLCLGTPIFDALLSLGTPGETLLLAASSKVQLEPHFLQVR